MVRTRVGYAGGTKENPTYHSLGDHTETLQLEYDPTHISYEELLDVFWNYHNPTSRPFSRQYMSIIFYHDETQRELAMERREREESRLGKMIYTEIEPYDGFYLAEPYHQKYRLRRVGKLEQAYLRIYPELEDFVDSTATARANGYLGGYGSCEQLEREIDRLGLPQSGRERLHEIVCR